MKNVRTHLVTMLVLMVIAAFLTSPLILAAQSYPATKEIPSLPPPPLPITQEQKAPESVLQGLIQAKENELVQLAAQREQRRETIKILEGLKEEAEKNLETARSAQEAAIKKVSTVEFGEYIATTNSAQNALRTVADRMAATIKDLEGILAAEQEEERALGRLRIRNEAERIQQALGK